MTLLPNNTGSPNSEPPLRMHSALLTPSPPVPSQTPDLIPSHSIQNLDNPLPGIFLAINSGYTHLMQRCSEITSQIENVSLEVISMQDMTLKDIQDQVEDLTLNRRVNDEVWDQCIEAIVALRAEMSELRVELRALHEKIDRESFTT